MTAGILAALSHAQQVSIHGYMSPSAPHSLHPRPPQPQRYGFSFCQHPFVYDPASKARVLQLENQIAQFQQFESSMMQVRGQRRLILRLTGRAATGWAGWSDSCVSVRA
jgi:hypothetical protein